MKPVYFLVFFLFLLACKKEVTEPAQQSIKYSQPDFALIPVRDAKWYIHTQGYYEWDDDVVWTSTSKQYIIDTAVHFYTFVEALGKDTLIDGYTFYVYAGLQRIRHTTDTAADNYQKKRVKYFRYYLMEDTIAKKVYDWYDKRSNEFHTVLDFSDSANSGEYQPSLAWPNMNIVKSGGWIVAGQVFPAWSMQNRQDANFQYFYKAIGIGSIAGILPDYFVRDKWGQVRTLDFVYKGDSIHFDFPLQ